MNIFNSLSYVEIISNILKTRKKVNSQFTFSRLAEAMGIQKTYVSRVMKGDAHFTSDQLYLACKFFEFNEEETDFLQLLLEIARCQINARRKILMTRARKIQDRHRETKTTLAAEIVETPQSTSYQSYYLDPLNLIVHTYLSIPQFRDNPKLLTHKLRLSTSGLEKILQTLQKLSLIRWNRNTESYEVLKDHLHLAGDSHINPAYQTLMRVASNDHCLRLRAEKKFNLAVTLSADTEAKNKIHDEFLVFLKAIEKYVRQASSEDVYQMNFDLFSWDPD